MLNLEHKLWVEKYRPNTLNDCFLPAKARKELESFRDTGTVPNLLLSGKAGIGKTTVAKALLNDIGAEYITINGSIKGNIDTLRNELQQFASTVSFSGGKKFIIIDEADYLSQQTQGALRGFIEEFSKNCGFIFTCNFKNRIIEPIQNSRLVEIEFLFRGDEKMELAKQVYQRLTSVLDNESVSYNPKIVQKFLIDHLKSSDDLRKLFNKAQKASLSGEFNGEIAIKAENDRLDDLVATIKNQNFTEMRKWVGENSDIDPINLYRFLFDSLKNLVPSVNEPVLAIILARYQYQHSFVADTELNLVACIAEVMSDCL